MSPSLQAACAVAAYGACCCTSLATHAGTLTVQLGNAESVTLVGALARWDADGNARRPVDPKGRIDAPAVTATAERRQDDLWVLTDLPPGRYDLVILAAPRIRIEGFHYPPVREFDPFLMHAAAVPEAPRRQVAKQIAASRHYENRVTPLYFAGDGQQIRVLVQLLRDKPTSFDRQFGAPVATLRHEVWQYTNHYGGWQKDKSTRVLDRVIMAKGQLRRWTWIWQPRLGGIEVAGEPVGVSYELPTRFDPQQVRGLVPY